MNTSAIKNVLRNLLGEKLTARIHGYWFLRLIKTKPLPDREVNYLRNLNLRDTLALDVGANGANIIFRQLERLCLMMKRCR